MIFSMDWSASRKLSFQIIKTILYLKKYIDDESTFSNIIIWFLARIDQQVIRYHSRLSKQCSILRSISMIKVHFSDIIIWFLARIDQQAEIYHSRRSKYYSNIKSISNIKVHFSQRNNMIFSKDWSASGQLSF